MTANSRFARIMIVAVVVVPVLGCTSPAKDPAQSRDNPLVLDCTGTDRAKTSLDDCGYVLNGRCFASSEVACSCAGCVDECITADSVPVQVSCPTDGGGTSTIGNGTEEGPGQ